MQGMAIRQSASTILAVKVDNAKLFGFFGVLDILRVGNLG